MLGSHGGQKTASDPLEPELQMVMSYCVGAGNQTWVVCKSNKSSSLSLQGFVKHPPSFASLPFGNRLSVSTEKKKKLAGMFNWEYLIPMGSRS